MIYSPFPPGILIIGGEPTAVKNSVEFWSATDPEEGSCELADYPRSMRGGQTADFVSGRIIACFDRSCEFYQEGHWTHLHDTIESRKDHSTATNGEAILLIGGFLKESTEWIALDGSYARPGPFEVRHGYNHCTMQPSPDVIVVTGGHGTQTPMAYVTRYHLTGDGNETPMTPMHRGRFVHACGIYQHNNQQVRKLCTLAIVKKSDLASGNSFFFMIFFRICLEYFSGFFDQNEVQTFFLTFRSH